MMFEFYFLIKTYLKKKIALSKSKRKMKIKFSLFYESRILSIFNKFFNIVNNISSLLQFSIYIPMTEFFDVLF